MVVDTPDAGLASVRDVIARLQSPVSDMPTLLSLLSGPLNSLGILPPQYRRYDNGLVPQGALNVRRHVLPLQRALLEHIIPAWESTFVEEKKTTLLSQFFCPDSFSFASTAAGEIALLAYSSILSLPLTDYSIRMLARLSVEYPIDRLHTAIFSENNADSAQKQLVTWEDCLRNIAAIPAKVANATGYKMIIPATLEHGKYFANISLRCEFLLFTLSTASSRDHISLTQLFTKLINVGVFPSSSSTPPSQPSFWKTTLPIIRRRLRSENHILYSSFFSQVIQSIPSALAQQTALASLLASLNGLQTPLDASASQRAMVTQEARLVKAVIGRLEPESLELWDNVGAVILDRHWNEGCSRIFVCWAAGAGEEEVNLKALEVLLTRTLDVWTSPEHIKHSLLAQHQYLTTLLLVTVSYFPPSAPEISSLSFSPGFISGIGTYISSLDYSVRRCGMLTAEVIAHHTDKKLNFGDWVGDEHGKLWARQLRLLIGGRDVDEDLDILVEEAQSAPQLSELDDEVVEIQSPATMHVDANAEAARPKPVAAHAGYDSDDSLTGYASPSSSRSASPTPSELEEIERDPTLRVGIKKIPRPVYLAQLGELVRNLSGPNNTEADQEADRIEMALTCGEELIRKKQGYGVELDENAANLVYGFVGLQNNFDLLEFDVKQQGILTALVVCCPRVSAPSVIEEFFKNQYSTGQRYAMLNALALAARELASLFVPAPDIQSPNADHGLFPSKMLPAALHRKYLAAGNQDISPVQRLLDSISGEAIDRGKEATANQVPNLVRERQLRIRKPAKISELQHGSHKTVAQRNSHIQFTDVAAEFFIAPMINRFWLFLRNEQTRESRTALQEPLYRYQGAGTGLILNPIVLTHFMGTLAVLMHASQHAPQWLMILAPDALELAVTVGTMPISQADGNDDDNSTDGQKNERGKQASVLTAALELVLVILDRCLELDSGRSLGLGDTTLLLGAGEWAGEVFAQLEKGARVEGGGGVQEVRLKRAAAGVLLKVDELTSKWRRSMVDVR